MHIELHVKIDGAASVDEGFTAVTMMIHKDLNKMIAMSMKDAESIKSSLHRSEKWAR